MSNSGKSTVVARLTKDPVEEVAPTVGFAVESVKMDGITMTMFDMSGEACTYSLTRVQHPSSEVTCGGHTYGALYRGSWGRESGLAHRGALGRGARSNSHQPTTSMALHEARWQRI